MSASITFDTREFERAMQELAEVSRKDASEVVNHQVGNLAIHAADQMPEVSQGNINKLESVAWWPKLIAAALGRQAGSGSIRNQASSKAYQSQYGLAVKTAMGGTMSRGERQWAQAAIKLSKKILYSRWAAHRFTKAFFYALAKKAQQAGGKARTPASKFLGLFQVDFQPASARDPQATFSSRFSYKKDRAAKSADSMEKKLQVAINKAIPITIEDMRQHAQDKLNAIAAKVSAR
jgi:hypothetical protein